MTPVPHNLEGQLTFVLVSPETCSFVGVVRILSLQLFPLHSHQEFPRHHGRCLHKCLQCRGFLHCCLCGDCAFDPSQLLDALQYHKCLHFFWCLLATCTRMINYFREGHVPFRFVKFSYMTHFFSTVFNLRSHSTIP